MCPVLDSCLKFALIDKPLEGGRRWYFEQLSCARRACLCRIGNKLDIQTSAIRRVLGCATSPAAGRGSTKPIYIHQKADCCTFRLDGVRVRDFFQSPISSNVNATRSSATFTYTEYVSHTTYSTLILLTFYCSNCPNGMLS